jgi:hypothetical protein
VRADGKIRPDDMAGGTFTISNGGVYGSMMSTPILNPPQSGILGMHKIEKRAVVIDDQIVIRPMMYLALSYDHRIIDGREGRIISGTDQGNGRRSAPFVNGCLTTRIAKTVSQNLPAKRKNRCRIAALISLLLVLVRAVTLGRFALPNLG